jgi:L-ascorbate metabolism protein UlaG (beta-lactamase superfamily)
MRDRITFVGHSTVRLDLGAVALLTDPLLRRRFLHVVRHAPEPSPSIARDVDAVLLSHLHPDHLDLPSLSRVGPEAVLVVPAGAARLLRRRGFGRITELRPGESTRVGEVEVRATPAVHDGRRYPIGPAVDALGFDLRAPGHRIYFAGDTELFDEMEELAGTDLALLPIGGWGPRVGRGHLDPRRAAEAAAMIRPRSVVPIHWGTYLRAGLAGRRPSLIAGPAREFVERLAELAPGVEARVLEPGASLELGR